MPYINTSLRITTPTKPPSHILQKQQSLLLISFKNNICIFTAYLMESAKNVEAESKAYAKGKAIAAAAPPTPIGGWRKGAAITDFVLRLGAIGATLGAAGMMGNTEQILPFFTQFLQFHAQWDDFPMFQYFVVANAVAGGYLVLSLPLSFVCIVRPYAVGPRLLLMILDTVMMAIVTSAASAAAGVVYLAHNGSDDANWMAVCMQFTDFCQATSMAVVVSFIAVVTFIGLIMVSALALKRI